MTFSRGDWTRKMILDPRHEQDTLHRAREDYLKSIGAELMFESGMYLSGLASPEHSQEITVVAVTPDAFVVFDTHFGADSNPERELGRIPRDRITSIDVKDESTPMLMNVLLRVSWREGETKTAEFKFVNPVLAHKASKAYWDNLRISQKASPTAEPAAGPAAELEDKGDQPSSSSTSPIDTEPDDTTSA